MPGAAQSARGIGQSMTKFEEIIPRCVGEFMVGLSPHVFGEVEFRRIGGEEHVQCCYVAS
jgi:hypothetical protein